MWRTGRNQPLKTWRERCSRSLMTSATARNGRERRGAAASWALRCGQSPRQKRWDTATGHGNQLMLYSKYRRDYWKVFCSFRFTFSKRYSLWRTVLWILAKTWDRALTSTLMKQSAFSSLTCLTRPVCDQLRPSLSAYGDHWSLSLPAVLHFIEHCVKGVMGYVAFWIWLLVLGVMHLKFIHVMWIKSILFNCWVILWCPGFDQFTIWRVSEWSPVFGVKNKNNERRVGGSIS